MFVNEMRHIPTACFKHGIISNLTKNRTNSGQESEGLCLNQDKLRNTANLLITPISNLWALILILQMFVQTCECKQLHVPKSSTSFKWYECNLGLVKVESMLISGNQ